MRLNETPEAVMNGHAFQAEGCGAACDGCGLRIYAMAYRIPGLPGLYCSIGCVETALFGNGNCRWCGAHIEKPYTSVDSRLCSEDCAANYYAHVAPFKSDRTAALGTGKRLSLWLTTRETEKKSLVRGRPRKNGHVMTAAERKRESRARCRNVTKIQEGSLLPRGAQNVTLQVIENTRLAGAKNAV